MHNNQEYSPSVLTRNQHNSAGHLPLSPTILSQYSNHEPTKEQVYGHHSTHKSSTYLRSDDGSSALTFLPKSTSKTGCIITNNENLPFKNFATQVPLQGILKDTDRPIIMDVTITPHSKTSINAITPGQTKMIRRSILGPLVTYESAIETKDAKRKLSLEHPLNETIDDPLNLLPTESNFKEQTIRVNYEDLVTAHTSRCQQSVMATHGTVKAADAAKASGLYQPGDVWHWMHLIAFKFGGNKLQIPNNLVAGTAEANTLHQLYELEIQNILKCTIEQVEVTAVAEHDNHHVGSNLLYRIKTPYFDLTFIIDLQTQKKPTSAEEAYVHYYIDHLIKLGKESVTESSNHLEQSFPYFKPSYVAQEETRKRQRLSTQLHS